MKKIGIVTIIDNNNIGNRLQNYALQQVLVGFGAECETIAVLGRDSDKLESAFKLFIKKCMAPLVDQKHAKIWRRYIRKNLFTEFTKQKIPTSYYSQAEYMEGGLADVYDGFIVGSDQVWNTEFVSGYLWYYLLEFAGKGQLKFSYAASVGTQDLPENYKSYFCDSWKKFDAISVREYSGKDIVKKVTGIDAAVCLDPTLLLTGKQWLEAAEPIKLPRKKYILTYFLGDKNIERKEEIDRIAKAENAVIYDLTDEKDKFFCITPGQFITLLKDACMVCTDSFHACVFSFIFNKRFIIYDRLGKIASMNSRIETLVNILHLKDCSYSKSVNIEGKYYGGDYKASKRYWEAEKNKSMNFIKNAINSISMR